MSAHDGMSKNAHDLFQIAVRVAGFDGPELMLEIHRRAPNRATEATVAAAMDTIAERHRTPEERAEREALRAAFLSRK